MYLDSPLSEILETLTDTNGGEPQQEYFAKDTSDSIHRLINDARNQIMYNNSIAPVNKNKELIRLLHERGVFQIKNAIPQVADALGISKNTVYMHLRNITNEDEK